MRRIVIALTVAVMAWLAAAAPAGAARSFVLKNGEVGCRVDRGDVPGFGAFMLPTATQVFRADGGGLLACQGWLPGGARLGHTYRARIECNGEPVGRIVVTPSGRVNAVCVFPPGTG
jgi:hypothetical protein